MFDGRVKWALPDDTGAVRDAVYADFKGRDGERDSRYVMMNSAACRHSLTGVFRHGIQNSRP